MFDSQCSDLIPDGEKCLGVRVSKQKQQRGKYMPHWHKFVATVQDEGQTGLSSFETDSWNWLHQPEQ